MTREKSFCLKLQAFMQKNPIFAEADPEFLYSCFCINSVAWAAFAQFLKVNFGDLDNLTVEKIADTQDLVRVGEVIES